MPDKSPIQRLLEKPMTRKEFIKHIGFMLLAAFGVTKLLENLLKADQSSQPKQVSNTTRWGGGKFGV